MLFSRICDEKVHFEIAIYVRLLYNMRMGYKIYSKVKNRCTRSKREMRNTGYRYKMIFSDIDGTLLDSHQQVSEDTRKEILRLEQEGVPFVLVSARMPEGLAPIRRQLGNHAPMVSYGGGLICNEDGEILSSCQMDLGTALEIKGLLDREYPHIVCNTYGFSRWVVDDDSNPWVVREEEITTLKAENGNIGEIFGKDGGIHKFLLMGEHEEIEQLEIRLKRKWPELSIAASSSCYLEVMNGKVRKSEGVRFLCGYYGISLEEVIAFGDGKNDMDMLKAAGNSYAMANAPIEVRESAKHVTLDNDHEGLLAALRENFA